MGQDAACRECEGGECEREEFERDRDLFHEDICTFRREGRYSDSRNVNSCCFSAGLNSRNRLETCRASPRWRSMAFCKVSDPRSCMKRGLMRRPHNAAVRSLSAVSCGGVCTMPSPVPMSCSRKSLNG